MDAAKLCIPHYSPPRPAPLRTLYRLFGQVDVLITLVGKSDINLIDATLVTALRLRHPELYRSLPKWRRDLLGGTSNAKYKITAKDWQKRITDTTGLTSKTRYRRRTRGWVTLFPRMEHPVGMIAPGRREACRVSDSTTFIGTSRSHPPHRRRERRNRYASNLSTSSPTAPGRANPSF